MGAKEVASKAFTKALELQAPAARSTIKRLRAVHPDDSPDRLARRLKTYYLATVTTSGGVSGAVSLAPAAGVGLALADGMAFTEASVFYVLALAELHGLHPEDLERRRLLVQTVLIGESAVKTLDAAASRTGGYWAKRIVQSIPMATINKINKLLGPRFITKYGVKQGILVLGKVVPAGVGAVLGAGGNHLVARGVVTAARKIFGPAPEDFIDPAAAGESGSSGRNDPWVEDSEMDVTPGKADDLRGAPDEDL